MNLIEFCVVKRPQEITQYRQKECFFAGWMLNDLVYQNREESSEQTIVSSQSEQTRVSRQRLRMLSGEERVDNTLSHHFAASCS